MRHLPTICSAWEISSRRFLWKNYMPVGNDASPDLMPTPEQRTETYRRIRDYRATKPLFAMDFQNDAEYVGGCIAGGRRYFHINANGDVDPCVRSVTDMQKNGSRWRKNSGKSALRKKQINCSACTVRKYCDSSDS